ncbi:MAG: ComEC/Rec2 family competence protein [Nitrospiraceae bacterium]
MPLRYISHRSTIFHPDATTDAQEFVLLFGDEVDTMDIQEAGRDEVVYRERTGWVRSDRLMDRHPLELYFIDVGQGDSTFFVTPAGRKILIDGGKGNEAFQFLVWKYRLDLPNPEPVEIDLLVLTHTDDDHIAGLISIIDHKLIHVRKIIHSGIAKFRTGVFDTPLGNLTGAGANRLLVTRHDAIRDLRRADLTQTMQAWFDVIVQEETASGLQYRAVDTRTDSMDFGDPDVTIRVLGPRLITHQDHGDLGYPWFASAAKTVNGHSVVLRVDCGNVRILLPGDLNIEGASHLLSDPAFAMEADAHVLKAPHHGSHEFDRRFLEAVKPQITVVSSGEAPDHGHPRANFLGAVGQVSRSAEPLLFSTELVAHFAVDRDADSSDADEPVDPTDPAMLGQARRRFKKRLNGIINVRTDGRSLYAARRVAAGYQFVTYGPLPAAPRS